MREQVLQNQEDLHEHKHYHGEECGCRHEHHDHGHHHEEAAGMSIIMAQTLHMKQDSSRRVR